MTTIEKNLESVGHLACTLQTPVSKIKRTAETLEIAPALTLNGVAHYAAADCERIAKYLQQVAHLDYVSPERLTPPPSETT